MDNETIKRTLLDLENKYWMAIQKKDVKTALDLTNDPCIVAGASGVASINRDKFEKMMTGAQYTLNSFKLENESAVVELISADVAILAYKVHEDLTVDGKGVSIDASESSTWVNRDGKWLCALHTESLIGDPYGRDKKSTVEKRYPEQNV